MRAALTVPALPAVVPCGRKPADRRPMRDLLDAI